MVNILFITYYGSRDQLKFVNDELINQGNNMFNFSLMELENENKKNNGKEYMPYDLLIESINVNDINLVLWWYIGTAYEKIQYVVQRSQKVKHMLYNWDDPNGWEDRELWKKAKLFDCVFTCCKESVDKYLSYGTKNAFYLTPGYDPTTNYIITNIVDADSRYDCDISIVCTTLYEENKYDMQQYINRKELIDNLYLNRDKFTFRVYGPRFLMDLYPECYSPYDLKNNKYEIPYHELNKIFNNSRINICTHTHCQYDGYLNERVGLILGSGGLLYIDKIKGLENIYEDGVDCVYIDKDNYIDQICKILKNYDDYFVIRNNGHEKNKIHTWSEWAKTVNEKYISKMYTIKPQVPEYTRTEYTKDDKTLNETKESAKESKCGVIVNNNSNVCDRVLKKKNNTTINLNISSAIVNKDIDININIIE